MKIEIEKLDFKKMNGLMPAVIQDSETLEVLMLGFMNEKALDKTISEGLVTFYSRSKERLWQKGESSGNTLSVVEIRRDCDSDSLLILAKPAGPTCHTGEVSCFGKSKFGLAKLFKLIEKRKQEMPDGSYTASLFKGGQEAILAKVEEESAEVLQAARSEGKQRLIEESCDLLYHMFVLLVAEGVDISDLEEEIGKRHEQS